MDKENFDPIVQHMKGFVQGFLFVLMIFVIVFFFFVVGYIDKKIGIGTDKSTGMEIEEDWREDIPLSEGVHQKQSSTSSYDLEQDIKRDFGSKSLNAKDREEVELKQRREEEDKFNYLK